MDNRLEEKLEECSYTSSLTRLKKKDLAELRSIYFNSIIDKDIGEYICFDELFFDDEKLAAEGLKVVKNAIAAAYLDTGATITDNSFNNWLCYLGRIIIEHTTKMLDETLEDLLEQAYADKTETNYLEEAEKADHIERARDLNMIKDYRPYGDN